MKSGFDIRYEMLYRNRTVKTTIAVLKIQNRERIRERENE